MCSCASMTKYFLYICLIILIGHFLSTLGQSLNNPVFYQNKKQRCNCESNAQCNEQDGTCPRDKCASNYFGNNCQHADVRLAMTNKPSNVQPELLDGDDTTCVTQYTGTAIFQTVNRVHFIWAYIFAENPITVKPTLTLRNPGDTNIKFNFLTLSSNSLLIKPDRDVMYNKLEISGLPKDICSLEVSLGRNLALSSTHTSGFNGVEQTTDGIDGSSPFSYNNYGGVNIIFSVRLLNDAIINHIQLIVQFKGCQFPACTFIYETYNGSIQRKGHQMQSNKIIKVNIEAIVKEVGFYGMMNRGAACEVDMYEMYIFGEFQCPKDWYGERCERYCPDGCDRYICDPDWGCPSACKNNWTDKWCHQQNAATTTTAMSSTTSIECSWGYGPDCQSSCADGCAGEGKCDINTGRCLSGCKPGYIPPLCNATCPLGTYDLNCSKTCVQCVKNLTTDEHECDPTSGECLIGCDLQYGGESCEGIIVKDEIASTTTSIFIGGFILLALVLLYRARKRREEECSEEVDRKRQTNEAAAVVEVDVAPQGGAAAPHGQETTSRGAVFVARAEPDIVKPEQREDEKIHDPSKRFWGHDKKLFQERSGEKTKTMETNL